jgi:hypothetical protein
MPEHDDVTERALRAVEELEQSGEAATLPREAIAALSAAVDLLARQRGDSPSDPVEERALRQRLRDLDAIEITESRPAAKAFAEAVRLFTRIAAVGNQCQKEVPFAWMYQKRTPEGQIVWTCTHPEPHESSV